jgi:hypothetical protein
LISASPADVTMSLKSRLNHSHFQALGPHLFQAARLKALHEDWSGLAVPTRGANGTDELVLERQRQVAMNGWRSVRRPW